MIESISWKTYLSIVIIAVIIYYLFIAFLERETLKNIIKGRQLPVIEDEPEESKSFSAFDELEVVVEDIRHILEKAGTQANKADLLKKINDRLANYGGLHQPAFRIAVSNFIIENAENICGVAYSEDELEEAWDRLPR